MELPKENCTIKVKTNNNNNFIGYWKPYVESEDNEVRPKKDYIGVFIVTIGDYKDLKIHIFENFNPIVSYEKLEL